MFSGDEHLLTSTAPTPAMSIHQTSVSSISWAGKTAPSYCPPASGCRPQTPQGLVREGVGPLTMHPPQLCFMFSLR